MRIDLSVGEKLQGQIQGGVYLVKAVNGELVTLRQIEDVKIKYDPNNRLFMSGGCMPNVELDELCVLREALDSIRDMTTNMYIHELIDELIGERPE